MLDIGEKLLRDDDFIKGVAFQIATNNEMKTLILQSVVRDVATKEDIRDLKHYVDVRIGDLDKRIDSLDKRIDSLDKRIDSLEKTVNARIDSLDKRMTMMQWVMMIFFTIFSVILTALTFFIANMPK